MKKITSAQKCTQRLFVRLCISSLMIASLSMSAIAQCVPIPNAISGEAFLDEDFSGSRAIGEGVQSNVLATAYDRFGSIVGSAVTNADGYYIIDDLTEGEDYQIIFSHNSGFAEGFQGADNRSAVQYHQAPACDVSFALAAAAPVCGEDPQFAAVCFVQGSIAEFGDGETIVGLEYGFDDNSPVVKYASHRETGSVWGLTWKSVTKEMFSSAFVKQNAELLDGPYAIYKTTVGNPHVTTKHADVSDLLGGTLAGLAVTDETDCTYGSQVGRVGLGNMIISPDESRLFVTLLDDNKVVSINTTDPTAENTRTYDIPRPVGLDLDAEYRVFALSWRGSKIYVGATVTASLSKSKDDSRAVVYELDPVTGEVTEVFSPSSQNFKGFWQDAVPSAYSHSHWFTDIEFTDEDHMLLNYSDRIGHRYCKPESFHRVDQQFPDLLAAYYDKESDEWVLESNGSLDSYTGSGVGNGEGPDGGEFFGFEFWPDYPEYHNETALGSILSIPGTGEVVVAVYDPLKDSYSGGYHRYRTNDGYIVGAKQMYTQSVTVNFGKATGFGDMTAICDAGGIEIGNFAWFDINGDGIQNAGETGIKDIPLNLYNDQCVLIGNTTTDERGHYVFNNDNVELGVFPNSTYFVELDESLYDPSTELYTIGNLEFSLCTADSGSNDALDCDINHSTNPCSIGAFVEVNVAETNHSFDIGLAPPTGFDLALSKRIVGNKVIKNGESISFLIEVTNQGGRSADRFEVVDYIPSGFTFDEVANPDWDLDGGVLRTQFGRLKPKGTVNRLLNLTAVAGIGFDHVNYAEISATYGLDGKLILDTDSTADDIKDNDKGGIPGTNTDDNITDNGDIDEDDHDPALPVIFDLAIKVELDEDKDYVTGDIVKFNINVYNQGNTTADRYALTQYSDAGLTFVEELSNGWITVEGNPTLRIEENLENGADAMHCIYYRIDAEVTEEYLSSYTEISQSIPVGGTENCDFDSTPDNLRGNDNGAEAFTTTDNYLQGVGSDDEDDHDIVVVTSRFADLALIKTVTKKTVNPGEEVEFNIEITNQGSQSVDKIEIMDYLPEGMELADDKWEALSGNRAKYIKILSEPLLGGNKTNVTITTRVSDDTKAGALVNYAEIYKMYSGGVDISDRDRDSTPDDIKDNDNGGNVGEESDNAIDLERAIDEDDQDPARVFVISSEIVGSGCLDNADNTSNGQFVDTFRIVGPSDDEWYASIAQNFFLTSSGPPPEAPMPVMIGEGNLTLIEEALGDGTSTYTIALIRLDGQVANISFRNTQDEIQSFERGPEFYTPTLIEGEIAVCNGGQETYTITNPIDGVNYTWTLENGGSFDGSNTGTSVTIDWSAADAPANHILTVSADSGCMEPGMVNVSNGVNTGAMFCIASMNLSLDNDCSVTVSPQMVLSGGVPTGAAFSVMLIDNQGEAIPNATLTSEHIGQTIEAKVIDGCSGNSCWANIFVEDKTAPTFACVETDQVFCNKVDQYPGPLAQDNCGGEVVITTLLDEYVDYPGCNPEFVGEFRRRYIAEDNQGNVSETCDVVVQVRRVNLDDIIFPADTEVTCNGFDMDEDGNPDPLMTGRPVYNNSFIFPMEANQALCDIITTYDDLNVPNDGTSLGGVIKVYRTWTVYEWCSDPLVRTETQIIKIRDLAPPVITSCPSDITVSATGGNCEATFSLPLPEATDACVGDNISITTTLNGLPYFDGDSRIVTLPFRAEPYTITYTVRDAINSATCTSEVTVIDDVAPLVVCNTHPVVSLNSNGQGYIYAATIDNGSTDACGIDTMLIRRLDAEGECGNANDGTFTNRVFFCCDDVGRENMVELRVIDLAGNMNSCMVSVFVQDKNTPVIGDLPDAIAECGDPLYPLEQFFGAAPTATDACQVVVTTDSIVNINSCGTGTIRRIFTADDGQGTDTSSQLITIINSNPFGIDDVTLFSQSFDIDGVCDMNQLHPDSLDAPFGRPQYNTDACDLVGDAFHDDIYPFGGDDNTCFKIVRNWFITDWCQEDDPDYEEITFTQIIKVTNSERPEIDTTAIPLFTTMDCDMGVINISATGSDDCSMGNSLSWTAVIDYYQNGDVTAPLEGFTVSGAGETASVNGTHPIGTHNVTWTFVDACGNSSAVIQEFTIATTMAPIFPCVDLSVGLTAMDTDGINGFDTEMACLFIDTMLNLVPNGSIMHPCDTPFELSFSADAIVKKDTFDCSNIGINVITAYAIDIFGNVSECTFELDVQDNNDDKVCINVKDCSSTPDDETFVADADCITTIANEDLDVMQINDDCGDLVITHNYFVQGDPGYTGTNDDTTLEGAVFGLGMTEVEWTIAIESNLAIMGRCTVKITVVDETAPVLTNCDITQSISANDDCEFVNSDPYAPTVTDNCDDMPTLVHNYSVAGDAGYTGTNNDKTLIGAVFQTGTTVVTWTATDASLNTSTCTTTFIVTDNTNPTLVCNDDDLEFDDVDGDCEFVLDQDVTFTGTDNCDGDIIATHTYPGTVNNTNLNGGTFPVGSTNVVFTVTDARGNQATCTVTIVVVDDNPPSITCEDDITVDANADCEYVQVDGSLDANAGSPCAGGLPVTHNYSVQGDLNYNGTNDNTTLAGAIFPIGTTPVIFSATINGETITCEINITVEDNTPPTLTCVGPQSFDLSDDADGMDCTYTYAGTGLDPTVVDNCDNMVTITHNYGGGGTTLDGAIFPEGPTTVIWTATDADGNSSTCTIVITITDNIAPQLACAPDLFEFLDLEDGNADCSYTVQAPGISFTAMDACDGTIVATHTVAGATNNTNLEGATFPLGDTDVVFTAVDGEGNIATCTITVRVTDGAAPSITCPANIIEDANDNCGYVTMNGEGDATASDPCGLLSLVHDYAVAGDAGYAGTNDDMTLDGAIFTVGTTMVTWTASDSAGLEATCTFSVTISDNDPAECIEQDTAIVNIGMSGSYIFSESDLSDPLVDNCSGMNLTYTFSPDSVTCDMAGDTLTVLFTAEDEEGNVSDECPLIIIVNNEIMAQCNPIDITVDLDVNGNANITPDQINMSGASICAGAPIVSISQSAFACNDAGDNDVTITVINGMDTATCVAIVTVTDTTFGPGLNCAANQDITCVDLEEDFGGSVLAWINASPGIVAIDDNCPETPMSNYTIDTTVILTPNVCGFGQSTRTFTVTDVAGNSDQCVQIFTVAGPTDLITQQEIDDLPIPSVVTFTDCQDPATLLPGTNGLGDITVMEVEALGECTNVTVTFNDVITPDPNGNMCNVVITRTFTITDLCQVDPAVPGSGVFTFVQTININDETGPSLLNNVPVEVFVGPDSDCMAFVDFSTLQFTDCNNVTYMDPSGVFSVGEHDVIINSMDVCGNDGLDTIALTVRDTSELEVMCRKLFPNLTDDVTLTVSLAASQYVTIVSGNECGGNTDALIFSFNPGDPSDSIRTFGCEFTDTLSQDTVFFFNTMGELVDSCIVQTLVEDPNDLCDGAAIVAGNINTEQGVGLPSFEVELRGADLMDMSDGSGNYAFPSMLVGGQYEVSPAKDGDDLNGVNSIDLVKIQRHLLGLEDLSSPYKLIAADINSDEKVSSGDLLALRKVLLGIDSEFTRNTSWRTVDAEYVFPDENDPWVSTFPETYMIGSLNSSMTIDFVGVKIGDVDNSVNVSQDEEIEERSETATVLHIHDSETSSVQMLATASDEYFAIQLTLMTADKEITAITSDVFEANDIEFHRVKDGIYNVIATAPYGALVAEGDIMFDLDLGEDSGSNVGKNINIATEIGLKAQAFLGESVISEISIVHSNDVTGVASLEVVQNRPNPWSDKTVISFTVPSRDVVTLQIFDMNGKLVSNTSQTYDVGNHNVEVDGAQLGQAGVYYYRLSYRADTQQYKMIKID